MTGVLGWDTLQLKLGPAIEYWTRVGKQGVSERGLQGLQKDDKLGESEGAMDNRNAN